MVLLHGKEVLHLTCKGVHKLRFTYAGYMKVWIDGKLILDRWRQSWNPGSAILDIPV